MRTSYTHDSALENQFLELADYELEDGEGYDHEDYEGLTTLMGEGEVFDNEIDLEGDQFAFSTALNLAKPFLRPLAQQAAQHLGQHFLGPNGGRLASSIVDRVWREAEGELEMEYEGDLEAEIERAGGDVAILREMQRFADMAAETDNEAVADQLMEQVANLAATLIPSMVTRQSQQEGDYLLPLAALAPVLAPMAIKAAAPLVQQGIGAIGRLFNRQPQRRRLVRRVPRIAARAAAQSARQMRAKQQRQQEFDPEGLTLQAILQQMARALASMPQTQPGAAPTMARRAQQAGSRRAAPQAAPVRAVRRNNGRQAEQLW